VAGIIEALGAGLLRALVAISAGLIIAAAAFLELAIAAADESVVLNAPLKGFFAAVAIAFGVISVLAGILFLIEQTWAWLRR
jgi:hypothetical protein